MTRGMILTVVAEIGIVGFNVSMLIDRDHTMAFGSAVLIATSLWSCYGLYVMDTRDRGLPKWLSRHPSALAQLQPGRPLWWQFAAFWVILLMSALFWTYQKFALSDVVMIVSVGLIVVAFVAWGILTWRLRLWCRSPNAGAPGR